MTYQQSDSPFAIRNHKEIVAILEDLAKHRTAINLDTREGISLVTAVLYVSADHKYVCMDVSQDEVLNQKIADSKQVEFVTQTGVKVRWHSSHLQLVAMKDGDAFSLHVPSEIERVQRREYFRLNTPQGAHALICKIPFEGQVIEVTLFDMSAGGIGVMIRGSLPEALSRGTLLEGCWIDFPVVGKLVLNLRVCGEWKTINSKSGEQIHRMGMQFVDLSRSASNFIQRYMMQLQAEQIVIADNP